MKTSVLTAMLFFVCSIFTAQFTHAQKKLLILGSSTSTCFFGPSSFENCYVTRLQRHYESIGMPFTLDNRAVAGDNVYLAMPLNYTPPPGRSRPRSYNNITEGLSNNPDVVLVNFPSNGYDEYSVDEVINCLRIIKQTANDAGKPCYITTSQPRNDPQSYTTQEVRNKMAEIKNHVLAEFGSYAINFWDGIAAPDNSLLPNMQVDGIHINDAGHKIFFERVLAKDIFQVTASQPQPPAPAPPPPPPPSYTGTGLTYKYYEGNWSSLPDFNGLNPVKTGSVSNVDMGPRNVSDYFAFLWEGYINIPNSGNYTFEIVSDDGSRLYFNTTYNVQAGAFVNNDGLHGTQSASNSAYINAGSYPVAISFFENSGGEQMEIFWTGPGIPRQHVPNSAFSNNSSSAQGAVNYKYYEGNWSMLPDFHSLQPVKSGSSATLDISPKNRTDHYAFLWEGYIKIPAAGNYYFETKSDDGSKLYFNSHYSAGATALVNNDGLHGLESAGNSVYIGSPGVYPIAISFFENAGDDRIEAYWTGPGFDKQPIPTEAFTTAGASSSNRVINEQVLAATGPASNGLNKNLTAFPNPFNQTLDIAYYNQTESKYINAGLYDLSGKLIRSELFKNIPAGSSRLKMNLKDGKSIPAGIYFLKIDVNGIPFKVVKLVKSKG